MTKRAERWAKPTPELHVSYELPPEAVNAIEGRRIASPVNGFGKMWQKTYTIRLPASEVTAQDVIHAWREHYRYFWPKRARFYGPEAPVGPGDVALINLTMPGGIRFSTGVLVIYADDESFSFMTPEGHVFAGMITFSARTEGAETVVQAQALIRGSDPLSEIGMMLGGHRAEDNHWIHTLTSLAKYFGIEAEVELERTLIDRRRQWKYFGAIVRSPVFRPKLKRAR